MQLRTLASTVSLAMFVIVHVAANYYTIDPNSVPLSWEYCTSSPMQRLRAAAELLLEQSMESCNS